MSLTRINPPLDYLRAASRPSLQNFELSRLSQAAHLRREVAILLDQWVEQVSEALLARWMLDHYDDMHESPLSPEELSHAFQEAGISPLPDFPGSSDAIAPAPPRLACYPAETAAKARK